MSGWQSALLAIACIGLALNAAYGKGKDAGRQQAEAVYAQLAKDAEKEVKAKEVAIDQIATAQLIGDQQRHITHREIIRESTHFIDRPIYRNQCIDADGLRLIDQLATNANGEDPAAFDDRPAAVAKTPAQH